MINSFLLPTLGGHLTSARHWALIFLCLLGWGTAQAQLEPPTDDPGEEEGPTAIVTIECDRVRVDFNSGTTEAYQWRFGDGSPDEIAQSTIHYYKDANFYTMRWGYRTVLNTPFSFHPFPLEAIFIGDGCCTNRQISKLVPKVLPSGQLDNSTIYVFGNLEADAPYQFNGCTFNVLPGSVVRVG